MSPRLFLRRPVRKVPAGPTRMVLAIICVFWVALQNSSSFATQTVAVNPSDDLQSMVDEYPAGTIFLLAPGIHRLQSVVPLNNDAFIGQKGAVLSGAALLTSFSQSGAYWISKVQVVKLPSYPGLCDPAHPVCMLPEDLFFDNSPKRRVASLSSVGPGTWYLDYNTGNVYMGDNPSGHAVEISSLAHAFSGAAVSVTIKGLVVEKYASAAQGGAIQGYASTSWTVKSSEVRLNHGIGIRSGNGMTITNCRVHHNGQLGIGGGGAHVTVQNNDVSFNNYAGYDYGWEAGGLKFAWVQNLVVRKNFSHDNAGPGFWTDINSRYVTYNSNQATRNKVAGILHEISYDATISNNSIWNDGYNPKGDGSLWWGAGILVSNSSNVVIYGNSVTNCMNGIGGILADRGVAPDGQPYLIQNLNVYGNTISQATGIAAGIMKASGFDDSVYTSLNNHFQDNTFNLTNPATYPYFYWLGEYWNLLTWNEYSSIH